MIYVSHIDIKLSELIVIQYHALSTCFHEYESYGPSFIP